MGAAVRGGMEAEDLAVASHGAVRRWWEGNPDADHGPCGAVDVAHRLAQAQADTALAAQVWSECAAAQSRASMSCCSPAQASHARSGCAGCTGSALDRCGDHVKCRKGV